MDENEMLFLHALLVDTKKENLQDSYIGMLTSFSLYSGEKWLNAYYVIQVKVINYLRYVQLLFILKGVS